MSGGVPFGNYRLERRLARGGMAEVFVARLIGVEGFERRVAIKRILPHLSESEEFRAMFLDEARLAAQLGHPNIVHIYDFGKVDDYYFIAMEFIDGIDIGRLIRRAKERPVPFELAARILADVCSGLHFAHNALDPGGRKLNIVHRDVTPQNVLVSNDGVIKLCDFGIAKAAFASGRTRPGVVKGKYAYMSPEQVEGRSLDGRSDVFSAGICLFELITGVPLFRRDDVTASMREIRDGKPINPEKFRRDVPEMLVRIMRRALQPARDRRYASAAAMHEELELYLKSADALATAQQVSDFVRQEAPRRGLEVSAEDPGTEKQHAKGRAAGTEVQSVAQALMRDAPRAGEGSQPSLPSARSQPSAPSQPSLPSQPSAASQPSHTSMVTAGHSPWRAFSAALVAAVGVVVVTLFAIRPWLTARTEPVIVRVPEPAPRPAEPPKAPAPPHEAELPPEVLTPAKPPTLDILSRPAGARVTVDGEALRAATPIRAETFTAGQHTVLVDKRGFQPRKLTLALGEGEHRTLDLELRPQRRGGAPTPAPAPSGLLTVRTVPWSKVFEGARLLGTTPMANVPLAAGTHTLTFVNPDLPPVKRSVTMRADEETRLSFELKR